MSEKQLWNISWDKRFILIISNVSHRYNCNVQHVHFNQQETKKLKAFTQSTSFHAPAENAKSDELRIALLMTCTQTVRFLSFICRFIPPNLHTFQKQRHFAKKKEDDTCPREGCGDRSNIRTVGRLETENGDGQIKMIFFEDFFGFSLKYSFDLVESKLFFF